jgi:spermidine synthase
MVGGALLAHVNARGSVLHEVRSFFGVHRVVVDQRARMISLFHGTTVHGRRSLDPALAYEPISYYHRGSPIARLFAIEAERLRGARIGVIGLGSGALVQHGRTGQRWDFFEIDPVVADIARTPEFFPFLSQTRPQVGLFFGDGRISLLRRPQTKYKLLIFDAFSSDAIRVHLLTFEAVELYLSRLEPDGLLVLHISNRYLVLEPVIAELARATGAACLIGSKGVSREEGLRGLDGSDWAVLSRDGAQLEGLRSEGWRVPRAAEPPVRLWTDDYSNVLAVLRWR